jgi:WD40 repeat protein
MMLRRSPDGHESLFSKEKQLFFQKTIDSPIERQTVLTPPPEDSGGPSDSAWSADGKLFAITNYTRHSVYLYEYPSGKLLREVPLKAGGGPVAVAISPDATNIACGTVYGFGLSLARASDGELLKEISLTDSTHTQSLAYSPRGDLLAAGRTDGIVQIWKADLSEVVKEFPAHVGAVSSLLWTPDERLITGGGVGDATIHIWNPQTAEPQGTLTSYREDYYLSVSPLGHYRSAPRGLWRELRYVVQLNDGSYLTLTADEFERRFGWKNDPDQVKLPPMTP